MLQAMARPLGLSRAPLVFMALGMQLLAIILLQEINFIAARLFVVSSYVVLLYALLPDLKRPEIAIIFVGATLNFIAIVANGGIMPADFSLMKGEYWTSTDRLGHEGFLRFSKDVLLRPEDINLRFLTDTLTPPGPAKIVFSVGDLFIATGATVLLGKALVRKSTHPALSNKVES